MATLYPNSLEQQLIEDRCDAEADKTAGALADAIYLKRGFKDEGEVCFLKSTFKAHLKVAVLAGQKMSVQHQKPVPFGKRGRGQVDED